ncbi:hypothetical protein D515_04522 [Grimontia indica]|uniref:Uncharacterized protein n=1 Tax=Grimontia indica TaxID=1056512 RepID=R1II97_9GAMM|nr:hypothetical protein D515_04522 [Grimontia indica]
MRAQTPERWQEERREGLSLTMRADLSVEGQSRRPLYV